MVAGTSHPLPQDIQEEDVWSSWGIEYRDVVLLDQDSERFAVFNLTSNDLNVQANYDSLKSMLVKAANLRHRVLPGGVAEEAWWS